MYVVVWSPFIGESLNTQVEPDNVYDLYDVMVFKNEAVVGHMCLEKFRVIAVLF